MSRRYGWCGAKLLIVYHFLLRLFSKLMLFLFVAAYPFSVAPAFSLFYWFVRYRVSSFVSFGCFFWRLPSTVSQNGLSGPSVDKTPYRKPHFKKTQPVKNDFILRWKIKGNKPTPSKISADRKAYLFDPTILITLKPLSYFV